MPHDTTPRLSGAPNFRGLGGYPTADGRHVRLNRVYRSDALSQLQPDDFTVLDSLPIGLVCDVRSQHERTAFPNGWPVIRQAGNPPIENLHLDVSNDLRAANKELSRAMRADPTAQGAHAVMLSTYRAMPRAFVGRLGPVFDWLCSSDRAMLVHCTAGKDRTGFVCAILLLALGVERSVVFSDYMLTAQRYNPATLSRNAAGGLSAAIGHELDAEVLQVLAGVREEYLELALQTVATEFGSLENYLQVAAGVNAQRRLELQAALLV